MTHEELLKKIENKYNNNSILNQAEIVNALYRVVELHKSTGLSWSDETKEYYCGACGDVAWVPYPCQTIKAIEKELM